MFQWLLFDLDNTLIDFSTASKRSLVTTFGEFDLVFSEEIYGVYQQVNGAVWAAFERREITAEALRPLRFQRLFQAIGQNGIDPAEFSRQFLMNLVEHTVAFPGTLPLLEGLSSKFRMSLVTNGLREVQRPRLDKLEMTHLFESIVVSDEIGVAKPHSGFFEYVLDSVHAPPHKSEILIIGDNLHSDIEGGKAFGIKTCWVSHGRRNETDIRPDYQVTSVLEVEALLNGREAK